MNPAAEHVFYETLGPVLNDLVVVDETGISIEGHFTPEQFVVIQTAYTKYLAIVANPSGKISQAID